MNIIPALPQPHYTPDRASELVAAVTPARAPRQAASEQERAERRQAPQQLVDALQRETLVEQYQQSRRQSAAAAGYAQQAQQAVDAYREVAQAERRDLLTDVLGISEFA